MSESDAELIDRYLQGSEAALTTLVQRQLTAVWNFIFRLTGVRAVADDLTQETFIQAWKNLKKFRREANFKTWLFTIARHQTIDWWRKNKITFTEEGIAEVEIVDTTPLPPEILAQHDSAAAASRLLALLPPPQREVVVLYFYENMTLAEIAALLARPFDTVKSQYRRALHKMRSALHAP